MRKGTATEIEERTRMEMRKAIGKGPGRGMATDMGTATDMGRATDMGTATEIETRGMGRGRRVTGIGTRALMKMEVPMEM